MKILFFVVYPEINAAARYRVFKYLEYLKKEKIDYRVCPPMSNKMFRVLYQTRNPVKKSLFYLLTFFIRLGDLFRVRGYDAVFIHQGLCYLGPPILEKIVARLSKCLIYDTDDAHFARPIFATGFGAKLFDRQRTAKLAGLSDEVIVSADYIKQYVQEYNPHVVIIPTSIDSQRYTVKNYDKDSSKFVTIGWAGSASGLVYLQDLEEVFQNLSKLYSIELKIISSRGINFKNVQMTLCRWSMMNEISDLQSFDIGIMPLPNSDFAKGKAGFKIIQYMGVGVPVVCSPVGINTKIINDGKNGFLARTKDDWFNKLSMLIEDIHLREKIGKKGRESIQAGYTIEQNAPQFIEVIKRNCNKGQQTIEPEEKQ